MMADSEVEVIETTAGQIADLLRRLGVAQDRVVTVMIEPDDWLTKARQESRRLVCRCVPPPLSRRRRVGPLT